MLLKVHSYALTFAVLIAMRCLIIFCAGICELC
uniref:Uncharacterized protein n=1 Tax=Arundo donax TaxID=35708 RepID=A0A0A9GLQ0_ARUDO